MEAQKVSSDDYLYRRSYGSPQRRYFNLDGTANSRVFKLRPKDEGRLSVDVKSLTTFAASIKDPEKFVLFEIAVAAVESLNLSAVHDPLTLYPDGEDNPAHAVIIGLHEEDEITPRLLADASKLLQK